MRITRSGPGFSLLYDGKTGAKVFNGLCKKINSGGEIVDLPIDPGPAREHGADILDDFKLHVADLMLQHESKLAHEEID